MPIFIKTELIKKEYLIQKDIRKKIINEHIKWIENLKKKGINIKSGFLVDEFKQSGAGGLLILEILWILTISLFTLFSKSLFSSSI